MCFFLCYPVVVVFFFTGIRTDKKPYRAKSRLSVLEPSAVILNFIFECQYFFLTVFHGAKVMVSAANEG